MTEKKTSGFILYQGGCRTDLLAQSAAGTFLIEDFDPPSAQIDGIKRTYRHLYLRQRRSGMGIFDLDTPEEDPPTLLTLD